VVKHFKWVRRGKVRVGQQPNAAEVRAYLAEARQDGSEPTLTGSRGQRVVKEE